MANLPRGWPHEWAQKCKSAFDVAREPLSGSATIAHPMTKWYPLCSDIWSRGLCVPTKTDGRIAASESPYQLVRWMCEKMRTKVCQWVSGWSAVWMSRWDPLLWSAWWMISMTLWRWTSNALWNRKCCEFRVNEHSRASQNWLWNFMKDISFFFYQRRSTFSLMTMWSINLLLQLD